VQVRTVDVPIEEAVRSEGRKGYDLLFVGVPEPKGRGGAFEESVSRISAMFPAPLAIAAARGTHHERPEPGQLSILVPINGTEVARRAAELAIATARRQDASITVLYVSNRKSARGGGGRAGRRLDQFEQAVVDDVVDLAARHDCKVKTAVRADITPAQAILGEAKRGSRNVIFMGVSRRPGDKLFFGDTAAAVFDRSPISILFLSG
jgi:nucleotide-binding universal stress UspA family protein